MLTGLQLKLAAGVAIGLMAYGVYVAIRHDAVADHQLIIERQNNEAGDNSDNARADFSNCPGGLWDYGAGKCRWTAAGRGH